MPEKTFSVFSVTQDLSGHSKPQPKDPRTPGSGNTGWLGWKKNRLLRCMREKINIAPDRTLAQLGTES